MSVRLACFVSSGILVLASCGDDDPATALCVGQASVEVCLTPTDDAFRVSGSGFQPGSAVRIGLGPDESPLDVEVGEDGRIPSEAEGESPLIAIASSDSGSGFPPLSITGTSDEGEAVDLSLSWPPVRD